MRVISRLTRCWRCYLLLSFASVLVFFLYFISQYDPKLEHYLQYNFYLNGGAQVERIKKLMETNNLEYEFINSNSKFCINNLDIEEDLALLNTQNDNPMRTNNAKQSNNDLLILIISQSSNFKHRSAIRQTWSKQLSSNTRFLFFIGNANFNRTSPSSMNVQNQIRMELAKFNDIIQINMPDNNSYLPTKTLVAIRWSLTYCSVAKYLLILSDSAVLNVNSLYKQVNFNSLDNNTLIGACNYTDEKFASGLRFFFDTIYKKTKQKESSSSNNNNNNKQEVQNQTSATRINNYKGEYCSNLGWMISLVGAERLWRAALRSPYMMKISPAFLNGYLAFKASLKHESRFVFHDVVPEKANCLQVLDADRNLLACAENFTFGNRYNNYIATWNNAPAQVQFGLSKL